jgi:isopenicillin N synthase-like dioxygenase
MASSCQYATTNPISRTSQDPNKPPTQIIDFSKFLHGTQDERSATAASILTGFRNSGFIYLVNHSIPAATVTNAFNRSANFFARPQSEKDSLSWTTPQSNRGYVASGREKVTLADQNDRAAIAALRASNPDLKESMEIGREGVPGQPNRWPSTLDAEGRAFTHDMQSFFTQCKTLHIELMRAIALALPSVSPDFFDAYTDKGDNNLRLLHYPPVRKAVFRDNPDQVRAGAHSDYGSVTLLFQDSSGGLEVLSPQETWVRATPVEGSIVVNAGDLLHRWSNGLIKSTKHRVVQPPATAEGDDEQGEEEMYPARYSIAYFCNPNFDMLIDALPGTFESEDQKLWEPIKSGDYLVMRLAATY